MGIRWKGHGLNKSSCGLYTHHDMLVIPVRHKIYISCCLLNAILMLTIHIVNACWQLDENVLGGNEFMLLNCKAPCFNCIVCKLY
jgi:hypothetical protein